MQKPLGGYQPDFRDIPDSVVEDFIHEHPNGGSVEEIGAAVGLTRIRVYQILNKALGKLQRACRERDISPADIPTAPQSVWDRLQNF